MSLSQDLSYYSKDLEHALDKLLIEQEVLVEGVTCPLDADISHVLLQHPKDGPHLGFKDIRAFQAGLGFESDFLGAVIFDSEGICLFANILGILYHVHRFLR
jgi:hypothetical protein